MAQLFKAVRTLRFADRHRRSCRPLRTLSSQKENWSSPRFEKKNLITNMYWTTHTLAGASGGVSAALPVAPRPLPLRLRRRENGEGEGLFGPQIWGDMGGYGIPRDTAGYSGIQWDTVGYSGIWGIQRNRARYRRMQRDTAGYYRNILQSTGVQCAVRSAAVCRLSKSKPYKPVSSYLFGATHILE
jgi:hypothetical protein